MSSAGSKWSSIAICFAHQFSLFSYWVKLLHFVVLFRVSLALIGLFVVCFLLLPSGVPCTSFSPW